jgi:NADPH2:quinone reductase
VLEAVGGDQFGVSLATARPITGRVVVYGNAAGNAQLSNADLIFLHRVHLVGLHIGALAEAESQILADLLDELHRLVDAGVIRPGPPAVHDLADGPKVAAMAGRATTGKMALRP